MTSKRTTARLSMVLVAVACAVSLTACGTDNECDPGNERLDALRAERVLDELAPGARRHQQLVNPADSNLFEEQCSGPEIIQSYDLDDEEAIESVTAFYVEVLESDGWSPTPEAAGLAYTKTIEGWEASASFFCHGADPGGCQLRLSAPPVSTS